MNSPFGKQSFLRTQIFDRPVRGREFFESVIRENIDLGRPDRIQLLFERKIIKTTPGKFRTRIINNGVFPSEAPPQTDKVKDCFSGGAS